jgi:hypothetical protein
MDEQTQTNSSRAEQIVNRILNRHQEEDVE